MREAANFLSGKVGKPHITAYTDHLSRCNTVRSSPFAIVPDVHAFNFPTGRQRVRDSGAATTAEAFFEVKTMTACPSRYDHDNEHVSPADCRAREVTLEYARKFKVLDRKYAADVVGEGDEALGPFEASQQQFYRGQVIPLCVG